MRKYIIAWSVLVALFFMFIPSLHTSAAEQNYANINEWLLENGYDELPDYDSNYQYIAFLDNSDKTYMYIYRFLSAGESAVIHNGACYVLNITALQRLGYYYAPAYIAENGSQYTESFLEYGLSTSECTYGGVTYTVNSKDLNEATHMSSGTFTCYYSDVNVYEGKRSNMDNMTLIYEKNIPPVVEVPVKDDSKLTQITVDGCRYNGIFYKWDDDIKQVISDRQFEKYMVISDPFVWGENKEVYSSLTFYFCSLSDSFTVDAETTLDFISDSLLSDPVYAYYHELVVYDTIDWIMVEYEVKEDGTLKYRSRRDVGDNVHPFASVNNNLYQGKKSNFTDEISGRIKWRNETLDKYVVVCNSDIYSSTGELLREATEETINNNTIYEGAELITENPNSSSLGIEDIITMIEDLVKGCIVVLEDAMVTNEPPAIMIKFDDYYGATFEANVLDLSWYAPYRKTVHAIITALLWGWTAFWAYKYLPKMIGGGGSE